MLSRENISLKSGFHYISKINIDPYKKYIELYWDKIGQTQKKNGLAEAHDFFFSHSRCEYLLYIDSKGNLLAGLRLVCDYNDSLSRICFKKGSFTFGKETCELSGLFVEVDKSSNDVNSINYDEMVSSIYEEMYSKLKKIAYHNRINSFVILASEEELSYISHFGNWPILLAIPTSNASNTLLAVID